MSPEKRPVLEKSNTIRELSSKAKPPAPLKKRIKKAHLSPPVIEAAEDMHDMFKRIMGPLDKTLFLPTGQRQARAIETGIFKMIEEGEIVIRTD